MANIVILLVIVALVTIMSIQNAAPVVLTFLFWKVETSLSIVIFLSILAGIIMTVVVVLSGYVKRFMKNKKLQEPAKKQAP